MVLDNLEKSYSGQYLLEESSDHVLSRPESDDTLGPSARYSHKQLLDKGKKNAAAHTFFNNYSYHCFSLDSLSAVASCSNAGQETGIPSTSSISNRQFVTSDPSTTAVMSRDRKRIEATASTSVVMDMYQAELMNVSLVRAKKKAKRPSASIDPNLNRIIPYLPNETEMMAEAARSFEEEWSVVLSSNQLKHQPLEISSIINWNTIEQSTSVSNISGTPSLSPGHNIFGSASISQAIPIEVQGTKIQSFDQNTFFLDSSFGDLGINLKMPEGHNLLATCDMSTFSVDHMDQICHQLSPGRTSNLVSQNQFSGLVSPTNGKDSCSHDNVPFDQQSLERLSLGYDNVVASQIDQQPEFAIVQLLPQNIPSDAEIMAYDYAQKLPRTWPSKSKNMAVRYSWEDPNHKVTQTEQFLSNRTLGHPQPVLPEQTTLKACSHFKGNNTTLCLGSIESFSDMIDPASEENNIPNDIMYDGDNWRLDPTLEQQDLRFLDDLYTPLWVKIKDGKRYGLCRECFKDNVVVWLKIKCSAYWYHMNTHHGIGSNGKYLAEPLDKRTMPDGSVEFYCHKCNRYKHVQRHPQDDIFKWWRHITVCHASSRKANVQNRLKRLYQHI